MKFKVSRTSLMFEDTKPAPCNGALLETVLETVRTTERFIQRQRLAGSPLHDQWYASGMNHREEGEDPVWLMKEVEDRVWTINLRTMEDLLMFIGEHGNCIVSDCYYNELAGEIEIYDDHRE